MILFPIEDINYHKFLNIFFITVVHKVKKYLRCDRSIKSSNHYISIGASKPLIQPIKVENTSCPTRRVLPSFKQSPPTSTIGLLYIQGAAEEPPMLITKIHTM